MINFEFVSPTKIIFGKDQENNIGKIIKDKGYRKILLHYGKSAIFKIGLYDKIINSLTENAIDFVELGGVVPNPKIDLVREGVKIVKREQIDFILAVGGGSVIDSAKAIACGAKVDFDPWLFSLHEKEPTSALPIGVILTISAAGSELSNSCVISNDQSHLKNGFNSDLIRPIFAIMNPELTFSVSPYQTACGIVDIMMHTLERYLSDVDDLFFTDEMGLALLRAVLNAGKRVMENPCDYNARATLMIASSFSHNGLTGLGSKMYFTVHKMEHVISGLYDEIAHGAGLAILFPAWAEYTKELFYDKWAKFTKIVLEKNFSTKEEATEFAINYLENFFKWLKMPTRLSDVKIYPNDFAEIARFATKNDQQSIVGVKKITEQDFLAILELAK